MPKFLFCETCNLYPDRISETNFVESIRAWNGAEYEATGEEKRDLEDSLFFCATCGTQLTNQEDTNASSPLSKMQGEFSSGEDLPNCKAY